MAASTCIDDFVFRFEGNGQRHIAIGPTIEPLRGDELEKQQDEQIPFQLIQNSLSHNCKAGPPKGGARFLLRPACRQKMQSRNE
jgi:hypothetical protein